MKKLGTLTACFLASICVTTIIGLIPTWFGKKVFDFVLFKDVTISMTALNQVYDSLPLSHGITIRELVTFAGTAFIIFKCQDYIAPHAANIILAQLLPFVVALEDRLISSTPDGLIFRALFTTIYKDSLYRPAILWTVALWLESIIIEAVCQGFSEGNFWFELWINAFTSCGVGAFYYLVLYALSIQPFSRVSYALLPLIALLQFSLAKRKSVKAKPAAKAAAKK